MKKRILSMAMVLVMCLGMLPMAAMADAASGEVAISEETFPDANFRAYVLTLPGAEDAVLNAEELAAITKISCSGIKKDDKEKIETLKGIEHFTALKELDCSGNVLAQVDLSANTALTVLNCSQNPLAALDVRALTELKKLNTSFTDLTALNVSANPALKELDCSHANLAALDVAVNRELLNLDCSENKLEELSVNSNSKLRELLCSGNELKTLDLSKNADLKKLVCSDNQFASIDVSCLKKLDELYCSDNQLTGLDLHENQELTYLECNNNRLTSLDLSDNNALEYFYADGNRRNVADQAVIAEVMPELDESKVFDLTGGRFQDGKVVYDEGAEKLTYSYVCGNNKTIDVTLAKADTTDPIITYANVTFQVVNGTWSDGETADKTVQVTLSNGRGTLAADQVPTGMIANQGYGEGKWDVEPVTEENAVTEDVTYRYVFVEHEPVISYAKVTFRVVNGKWADGTTEDKVVDVTLTDGRGTLKADQIPTGMVANEGYEGGKWNPAPETKENGIIGNVTYTYEFAEKGAPTEPTTPTTPSEPTEPSTEPTQPSTEPTEPSTEPTDPSKPTDPSEPTVPADPDARQYTLTFETNGGTEVKPVRAAENSVIDLKEYKTTRSGYTFAGWFSDKELTVKMQSVKLTADTTVYAKWNEGQENPFTDVKESDYFYQPVLWAVGEGITGGMTPTTFGPEVSCTRAHAVTFLWSMSGKPEPKSTNNPFKDVTESDYYYKAVLWAVENGITGGMGEGIFGPNAICQRGQIVTFLWRMSGSPKATIKNPFTDIQEKDYYYDAVLWAVEKGVTSGMAPDRFGPTSTCTRGQIVTFLWRTAGSPK